MDFEWDSQLTSTVLSQPAVDDLKLTVMPVHSHSHCAYLSVHISFACVCVYTLCRIRFTPVAEVSSKQILVLD